MKFYLLRKVASLIIWYLSRGGFVIMNPNDASIIFREGSVRPELHFPWHLAPDIPEGGPDIPMPPYLQVALVLTFALGKDWVMQFLQYYLHNESEVESDLDSYKQQMLARMQTEQAAQAAGQPEAGERTLH